MRMQHVWGTNVSLYTELFREILKNGVRIGVVRGNHDVNLQAIDFEKVGLAVDFYGDVYQHANLKIVHGHQYDIFCADDPSGELVSVGFVMTRCYAEGGDFGHSSQGDLAKRGALGEKIWEEVFNRKYEKFKDKVVRNGCAYLYRREDVELWRLARKYRTLFDRWERAHTLQIVQELIRSTCGGHNEYFVKMEPTELLVLGHTHVPLLSHLERELLEGRWITYANPGSWTEQNDWWGFVRVTTEPKESAENDWDFAKATFVELVDFEGPGKEKVKSSSVVPWHPESEAQERQERRRNAESKHRADQRLETYLREARERVLIPPDVGNLHSREHAAVPEGWLCEPDFYGTNDGCDCGCGIPDPDCKCAKEKECVPQCCYNN